MEAILELVVPQLDGGIFTPMFDTMLNQMSPRNETDCTAGGNSSANHSHNATSCQPKSAYVDFGRPLLAWYVGRLKSQIPLLVVAGLVWLILLAVLIAVYSRLARVRKSRTRRVGDMVYDPKRLRPLFGLLTAVIVLIVIGCLFAILHWAGRADFSGMSELSGNSSAANNQTKSNASATAGRSHLIAMFRRTIDEFDNFVELSIVETNASVLAVCREAFPEVLNTLDIVATSLLDRLARDFQLTPLLVSFDEFISLVKLLVNSMRAIMQSRDSVVEPLTQFATLIDSERRKLEELTTDACSPSASNPLPAETVYLCRRIADQLKWLQVGIDPRRLNSDSSVTVVTLLEKMLKLNFSQVEGQVASAKGQLYGSLDLVRKEVQKLFDSGVLELSQKFNLALKNAESFRSGLRGAKRDQGFLSAMETVDRLVHALSVTLAIGSFVFLAMLFLAMFVSIRYLLSFRSANSSRLNNSNGEDEIPLQHINQGNGSSVGPRPSPKEPRDWHSKCLFGSALLVLAALLYAAAVFYAGAEAHMDACRYVTTKPGVSYVDRSIYEASERIFWPMVEAKIPEDLAEYLSLSRDIIPSNLIGDILDQCDNDSATIFQALALSSAADRIINASKLLRAPFVTAELRKGGEMIQDLVRGLNTSNLIPSEVDDLLQKTLPSFAAVIDAENFAPSILELSKPLLLMNVTQFARLRNDLHQLETSLRRADANDRRADLISYTSEQAAKYIREKEWNLTMGVKRLLKHYTTLQINRRLTNLTLALSMKAVALKATLTDKPFLLQSIGFRYRQTIEQHIPLIASLIDVLISRLLNRVGRCSPLRDIFQIPIGWCGQQIKPLSLTGVYLMASCLAFYILVHLMLALMYLMVKQVFNGPKYSA